MAQQNLVLASSSVFRKQLLERLGMPFVCISPDIDETPLVNEDASALVQRLAAGKAAAVAAEHSNAVIIASDQTCVSADGKLLGKPYKHEKAVAQLHELQDSTVHFFTSLHVLDTNSGNVQTAVDQTVVHFRPLTLEQINSYLHQEQPYQCAGSFKSEGLGIRLFKAIENEDPTALIGLPMIKLAGMLAEFGFDPLQT